MKFRYLAICGLLMLPLLACSKNDQSATGLAQTASNAAADAQVANASSSEGASGLRESYQQCLDSTAGVTASMQACISEEYAYQEQRLNAVYTQLLRVLGSEKSQMLRDAQQQWEASRDAACAPEDDAPGQGQMLMANDCAVGRLAERADALQHMLRTSVAN